MCSTITTKLGNKTRSLRTKQNWTQTWQRARVLLWRSIVNHCKLYEVHFFLGQFPNMELMFLLLSPLFYLLNCYFFCGCVTSVDITQFLTGCLCALHYMSKLDHLILFEYHTHHPWVCPCPWSGCPCSPLASYSCSAGCWWVCSGCLSHPVAPSPCLHS